MAEQVNVIDRCPTADEIVGYDEVPHAKVDDAIFRKGTVL
jgi:hypothetical protein